MLLWIPMKFVSGKFKPVIKKAMVELDGTVCNFISLYLLNLFPHWLNIFFFFEISTFFPIWITQVHHSVSLHLCERIGPSTTDTSVQVDFFFLHPIIACQTNHSLDFSLFSTLKKIVWLYHLLCRPYSVCWPWIVCHKSHTPPGTWCLINKLVDALSCWWFCLTVLWALFGSFVWVMGKIPSKKWHPVAEFLLFHGNGLFSSIIICFI